MVIDSKVPRMTASDLGERLREHPELQARIEEYLDVTLAAGCRSERS